MAAYGSLRPARAANECGAIAVGGTATCTPAGNNFTSGIDYDVNDATIIAQDGVVINTTAGGASGIANGAAGAGLGNLSVTTQGTVSIATSGNNAHGISVGSNSGNIAITGSPNTRVSTSGTTAHGVLAYSTGNNNLAINNSGAITTSGNSAAGIATLNTGGVSTINTGAITSSGNNSFGIYSRSIGGTIDIASTSITAVNGFGINAIAYAAGSGTVSITSSGAVTANNYAILAGSQYGNVNVNTQSQVTATSAGTAAIYATAISGNIAITSTGVSALGAGSYGIVARNTTGTQSITDTGTISASGAGIYAVSTGGSTNISVNNISSGGYGILTYGATGVTVTASGQIASTGAGYDAIYAVGPGAISVTTNGLVSTSGAGADGITAYSYASTANVTVTSVNAADDGLAIYGATGATVISTGTITAGDEGMEVTTGAGGNVLITVNNVTATGADNDAIRVTSGGTVTINVNGAVLGGATSSTGEAIDIRASTGSVINIGTNGSVNSLSGFAIDNAGSGPLTINNSGTISGSLVFGGNGDVLNNLSLNSVNLSRFTDTNADGIRDTEAVAILDFGAGTDTFNNSATGALRVSTVTGATAFNTTNETFATGSAGLSLTNTGVEQAHILNLETFINSGIISLADAQTGGTGPVAGDVLVITSLGAPGVAGTSNFISNGGQLHLDTVLNNGVVDTSDVLIVDTVTTGTGATSVTITNAGGLGGVTGTGATDGIRIVEVRGTGSAADAFSLSNAVVGGILEYELARADGQNWYLQSDGTIAKQVSAYQALPLALAEFARDQMPWTQHRWGNVPGQRNTQTGAWIRGGYVRGVAAFSSTQQYESRNRFAQAGYDVVINSTLPGAVSIGALLQHTSTDTNVTNGNGSRFDASGYGAGLNALWASGRGSFIETAAILNYFNIGLDRPGLRDVASTYAYAYSFGAQIGHQFAGTRDQDHWTVTPRAALTYIDSAIDDFTDASNISVDFMDSDSLLLDIGVISGVEISLEAQRTFSVSASLGVEHDFSDPMKLTANTVAFSASDDDTRAKLGVSSDLHLGQEASLFLRANVARSFDGNDETIAGNAGIRFRF